MNVAIPTDREGSEMNLLINHQRSFFGDDRREEQEKLFALI